MRSENGQGKFLYHLLAFLTVAVWGVTFVSTKTLLLGGLKPDQIFAIRFIMAYLGMWGIHFYRRLSVKNHKSQFIGKTGSIADEAIFMLLGISGGSIYFLTENTALQYTQACNVSFIVCSAPLLTMLLTWACKRIFKNGLMSGLEDVRMDWHLLTGTAMAIGGMAMVIFNGYALELSPKGDFMALGAAICWSVYSIFMGQMTKKYGTVYATRKVFFYGLLTIIPFLLLGDNSNLASVSFSDPAVWGNLLFLGLVASLVCFAVWNRVMAAIGNVTSTNYVYLNPVFTLIFASLLLGERMDWVSGIGSALILAGVILAGSGSNRK